MTPPNLFLAGWPSPTGMSDAAPAPPGAPPAAAAEPAPVSSEREFRRRLIAALRRGNIRELRALWHDPRLEPHMTLFVLLAVAFTVGAFIWVVEPLLLGS